MNKYKNNKIKISDDNHIPTVRHQYSPATGELVVREKPEPFLKGPIPMDWLSKVAQMPGKVINVSLAIRWLTDMNDNLPIKLTKVAMQNFNFSSDAASDAIKILEKEGLIKVLRLPGQKTIIEISNNWK